MANILKRLSVTFDPNKKIAQKGEVLVGLGNTQEENEGVVLQHKTQSKRYACLSQFVYEANFDSFDPDTCCKQIYIEDFSVDTVLSIWIFIHRIHHKSMPKNIDTWIDYASRWERGDTSTTGKAFESYGCLQNALSLNKQNQTPKEILEKSLIFLDYLIRHNIDPVHIPAIPAMVQYTDAKSSLLSEYEKYENIVNNSQVSIFHIPKIDNGKKKKVSGIFIEMSMVTSIQKVFLRNDENSPTGDGYALMAIYNPNAKGTGNDIVISVDPMKNIYLKSLWYALEKEENLLWNGKRPVDNPRPLKSYLDGNGPSQPWWDDMGKYTLIAAPKMHDSMYGRRVTWDQVKQLIDELYNEGIS